MHKELDAYNKERSEASSARRGADKMNEIKRRGILQSLTTTAIARYKFYK